MPVAFEDLTLHYQPQMTADGTRIASVEALLRVTKPRPRLMGPMDVLHLFNAPEHAEALDWWALETACRDALLWPAIPVGVNLTAGRFRDPTFADKLCALVARLGLPPQRLELEIVEGDYIGDFDAAVKTINALRERGFSVALDDFGTGYSSLTYLLKLPVDKLKIDKSFVDGLEYAQSAVIVHAVVAMARALGLKITAEGVETEEQQCFLKLAGCHYLQGWLFSKAAPAKNITKMLAQAAPVRATA